MSEHAASSATCCGASATAMCPGCPLHAPPYGPLRVEQWEERSGDYAAGGGPDPLWECPHCGAAVSNCAAHEHWHRIGVVR